MNAGSQRANEVEECMGQTAGPMELLPPNSSEGDIPEYSCADKMSKSNDEKQESVGISHIVPRDPQKRRTTISVEEVPSGSSSETRNVLGVLNCNSTTWRPAPIWPNVLPHSLHGYYYEILHRTGSQNENSPTAIPAELWGSPSWAVSVHGGAPGEMIFQEETFDVWKMATFVGTTTQEL